MLTNRRMRLLWHALSLFGCSLVVFLTVRVAGQGILSEEVRMRSWTYQSHATAMHVEQNEVQVGVVVRDSKGQIVNGLKPGDFAVYDNGKKQTISDFSTENSVLRSVEAEGSATNTSEVREGPPKPRYVALFFDDLNTKFGDIRHVQDAAENFIRHGVSRGDKIGLFTSSALEIVDFTPDPSEVLTAVEKLKSHQRLLGTTGCPRITAYDGYLIANNLDADTYQTILAAAVQCGCIDQTNLDVPVCQEEQSQIIRVQADEIWESTREISRETLDGIQRVTDYLAGRPGERILVLASSGFLTGTMEERADRVIDDALRSGIIINTLDAKGLYNEDPSHGRIQGEAVADSIAAAMEARHEAETFGQAQASGTATMADFALGTGGRFFQNRNDLAVGYYRLAAAPQTKYLLGFSPEKANFNGKFHKLKVEVNAPGKVDVQARPGYFALKNNATETTSPSPPEMMDREVSAEDEMRDLPGSASYKLQNGDSGKKELMMEFHVNLSQLPIQRDKDRFAEQLDFVAVLFDERGTLVVGKEAEMTLRLKPETFERLSRTGITATMSLPVAAGNYRLRTVIREEAKSEMTAHSQQVEVH